MLIAWLTTQSHARFTSSGTQHMTEATGGVGVHPTNIAHLRIAEYVAAQIKPLLK